jgi:hypothetical protein
MEENQLTVKCERYVNSFKKKPRKKPLATYSEEEIE